MAFRVPNKNAVQVEKGDTLTEIAKEYLGVAGQYKQLATINQISDPNLIYVGQTIALDKDTATGGSGGSSSGSTGTKTANTNQATITAFGLQSNSDNTLFATWDWSKSNTEKYQISWEYYTDNGVWFVGSSSSISVDENDPKASRQSTYSIPSNAKRVRFRVKPIAKTKSSSSKTRYWTANWTSYKYYTNSEYGAPDAPSGLQVEIEKYKLTATLDNLKSDITKVEFQVVKNNSTVFKTGKANVQTGHVSYSCNVDAGGEYKVRCRAYIDNISGEWSEYSANQITIPATPSGITAIKANSETSVYLEWSAVNTATKYDIEYAIKKEYFDGSDQTTTVSDIEFTHYEKTGLETGQEYFFRVRAVNDKGASGWTDAKSVTIGKAPAAPTTWSSSTRVITGEDLILYWMHNAEDGSSQTYADLELYIGGEKIVIPLIKNDRPEDEKDKTSSYIIDTTEFVEGTQVQWRVRTAGVTKKLGDWSVQRTIDIYAPPTLELTITDSEDNAVETVTSFPIKVYALAGPNTQIPVGYYLTVIANESYETVDRIGNTLTVSQGDQVYSKHFDISDVLDVELSAGDIDLENGVEYTISCTVAMNSGLTVENSTNFIVSWVDAGNEPNAEITVDEDTLVAYIRPYCESTTLTQYKVTYDGSAYTITTEEVGWMYGDIVPGAHITSGEQVYSGVTADGVEVYYCTVETSVLVEGVTLAVYRREFDGSFVELASGITNNRYTTVTDPHPALDLARYRIVATTDTTGAVSYSDLPGYPIGGIAVIVQWDEEWSTFDVTEDVELVQPPWSGSMLKLPYNIDVSDNHQPDVELIKYIGRDHPTAYYGTQKGSTSTWNVAIRKDDDETLYGLRRLAKWMGDVYVREPSGSGYWANIAVSFSQKHRELTIPVTLNITRVEGGV